jgi:hypothetical protein
MTTQNPKPECTAPSSEAAAPAADTRIERAIVDTSQFRTSAALTLLSAWDRWRGARVLPTRRDMNLADITALLPTVVVLEVRSPQETTIRLAGTLLCTALGRELRGLNWIELTAPEARPRRAARLQAIVAQPCGALMSGRIAARSGMSFEIEQLALPVRPDEPAAPMQILGVVSLLPGQMRPAHVADSELGRLPEQLQYLDIGAGVPADN